MVKGTRPPPSNTFKIQLGWIFIWPHEQLKEYDQDNKIGAWHNQPIDWIGPLQPPVLPNKSQSGAFQVTWPLWLPGHRQLSHKDPVLMPYGWLSTANRWSRWWRGRKSYPSVEVQLVYSAAPADKATKTF